MERELWPRPEVEDSVPKLPESPLVVPWFMPEPELVPVPVVFPELFPALPSFEGVELHAIQNIIDAIKPNANLINFIFPPDDDYVMQDCRRDSAIAAMPDEWRTPWNAVCNCSLRNLVHGTQTEGATTMRSKHQASLSLFAIALFSILASPIIGATEGAEAKVLAKIHFENQNEIKSAQLARSKDSSSAVKSFADMLVREHTATDQELTDMARTKGFAIDRFVPETDVEKAAVARDQKQFELLSQLTGTDFDREFAYSQQLCHATQIAYLRMVRPTLLDATVGNYIDRLIPVIQGHLDQARRLTGIIVE